MWHEIFSKSNRNQLSLLHHSLKEEQAEVSALFDLKTDGVDFESLLKISALRAHRCSLILQHYTFLFQIEDKNFEAAITSIIDLHKKLLTEKSRLNAQIHFLHFSEALQKCLSVIETLFAGRLDTSPKNNLMTRYLSNLKNGSAHLQNLSLLSREPLKAPGLSL